MFNPFGEAEYGLGVFRASLPDGTVVWGHDGGIPGYITIALSTEDGRRQCTVSVNPWLGDFNPALLELLFLAFGVTVPASAMATAATAPLLPRLDRLPWA